MKQLLLIIGILMACTAQSQPKPKTKPIYLSDTASTRNWALGITSGYKYEYISIHSESEREMTITKNYDTLEIFGNKLRVIKMADGRLYELITGSDGIKRIVPIISQPKANPEKQ